LLILQETGPNQYTPRVSSIDRTGRSVSAFLSGPGVYAAGGTLAGAVPQFNLTNLRPDRFFLPFTSRGSSGGNGW
jgi:hypothetical protein